MNSDNPVTERLEMLQRQWTEHIETKVRTLRWLFQADEQDMLRAFVETENADAGVTNDLFLQLNIPFVDAKVHGYALTDAFEDIFLEAPQPEGPDGELPPAWVPPPRQPNASGETVLQSCLESFCLHYKAQLAHLVLLLSPLSISSPKAYLNWLAALSRAPLPAPVRLLVPDRADHPQLASLDSQAAAGTVRSQVADLDMPTALCEIAEGSCDEDDPPSVFRKHYVLMSAALGKGALPAAQGHAQDALTVTASHDLPQLEPAVHLTLAAAHLGLKDHHAAIDRYRAAQASSRRAMEKQEPGAAKLLVQSLFGECSVFLLVKDHEAATPGYREAAAVATGDQDPKMALEAHRMAAWCLARSSRWDEAYQEGLRTVELAETIPAAELPQTGMRFAARDLCKVVRKWRFPGEMRRDVEERLAKLLGPDWERALETELDA